MSSQPVIYQRLEAAVVFAVSLYLYLQFHNSFLWYVGLFLAIDLSMLGYVVNTRVGAHLYNIGHSLMIPAVLFLAAYWQGSSMLLALALIWLGHIGWDRALGYGLKFSDGFTHTHLGMIGKDKK